MTVHSAIRRPECPSENEVLSLVRGTVAGETKESLQRHVDDCTTCQDLFAVLLDGTGGVLVGSGARSSRRGAELDAFAPGAAVGRYRIRKVIGAGAMGIVYLADDPSLHRAVAIKVLRNQRDEASARLLREAQALARISHPHVIVVHEVGTVGEHVFMAMEFVEGMSLSEWLGDGPRETTEILEHFAQAGRGLQVAHDAELVHRDFKPDNVLVGKDGRVRVVDFGLAREDVVVDGSSVARETEIGKLMTLTQTGAFMGTPAYMSPEQYEGKRADPRSDQFSFAVALFEALYGRRPHTAKTLHELSVAVLSGNVEVPKTSRTIPRHVRSALLRALAVDPAERFPSMDALLAALSPSRKKRGSAAKSAAIALGAGLAIAAYLAFRPSAGTSNVVQAPQPKVSTSILPATSEAPTATATAPVASATPADTRMHTAPTSPLKIRALAPASVIPAPSAPNAKPTAGDLFDTVR